MTTPPHVPPGPVSRLADPLSIDACDEPVRRYLLHALGDPSRAPTRVRLAMTGRIRVGPWLRFTATEEISAEGFRWTARAGIGRLRPLRVVDFYEHGAAATDGWLGLRFLHADDHDTVRSAAARAAVERIWCPGALLPGHGVRWRAEGDDVIVATLDISPEEVELRMEIDAEGRLRRVGLARWGRVGSKYYRYIPFGATVGSERRFGDLTLPGDVTVAWWFGTDRETSFFRAGLQAAEPLTAPV